MPSTEIEGLTIHYDHLTPPTTAGGQRVVYIHGTGCNAQVFAAHMRAIAAEHEVVALDLPGHGRSGGNGFRGAADHAFFVGALIEHMGWDRCVVAGHSLGGGIALSVAIYFPQLVSALMLIDTGARLRVNPKILELARQAALAGRSPGGDSRAGFADGTPPAIVDEVNALTAGCDPAVKYRDWVADDSFDVMGRLAQLAVPTLAICGAEDPLTPLKYHEFIRDCLPDCRLEVVDGAGHWPFAEQPQAFNSSVSEFLASL
ncbi:MAG: alpha/beta fold hydrolase [Gammaproteobacteria bacterium]